MIEMLPEFPGAAVDVRGLVHVADPFKHRDTKPSTSRRCMIPSIFSTPVSPCWTGSLNRAAHCAVDFDASAARPHGLES
jgi:hypothetical protein